ncbi:hypothetical protein SBA5_1140016 [Candidatus Sulfotelmatomonas gaucii]|uniref:Uncharacterized protein n=1 Tax=Candidatus Sulfuritelmatomonas gaucii TaxID=2043161 RepID=A0A2N9L4A7_9BACT|nr:hypothetical protein SBA5_1140016 [Candidatus Sulfotelmatomonas gaucii]
MTNESLLDALAHDSTVAIVDRHAADVRNREALIEAIARLTRLGLEGHVRLFQAQQREVPAGSSKAGAYDSERHDLRGAEDRDIEQ